MDRRFAGKVAVVTGGGSGIGGATVRRLVDEGARVLLVDRDEAAGRQVASAAGAAVSFAACDVSRAEEVRGVAQRAIGGWGRIDVLVNCAAVMSFARIVDTDEETWAQVLQTNLTAAYRFIRWCVPAMPPGSAIVNVGSVHAHRSTELVGPYAVSKAGLEALTRAVSVEHRSAGIRANVVAPGATDTPMLWSNPNVASGVERLESPVAAAEHVAAAIAFLASPDGAAITGATLVVDHGRMVHL